MKRLNKYIRVRFQRRARFEMTVSDFIKTLGDGLKKTNPIPIRSVENLETHYGLK